VEHAYAKFGFLTASCVKHTNKQTNKQTQKSPLKTQLTLLTISVLFLFSFIFAVSGTFFAKIFGSWGNLGRITKLEDNTNLQ